MGVQLIQEGQVDSNQPNTPQAPQPVGIAPNAGPAPILIPVSANPSQTGTPQTTVVNGGNQHSSKKGLLVVILIVMGLLTVAAGAYYLFNNYMNQQSSAPAATTTVATPTPEVAEMNRLERELNGLESSSVDEDFKDIDQDLSNL